MRGYQLVFNVAGDPVAQIVVAATAPRSTRSRPARAPTPTRVRRARRRRVHARPLRARGLSAFVDAAASNDAVARRRRRRATHDARDDGPPADARRRARRAPRALRLSASFRPGQERAVESVLAGRDTLVVMPTGGGKSLCYQVPALLLPGLTVVVSPLISLMKDQVDALDRARPAGHVRQQHAHQRARSPTACARARAARSSCSTSRPSASTSARTAERLREIGVSLLAVDEAHCISEWGHDFRPSYLRIAQVRERLGWPPAIALTATATPRRARRTSRASSRCDERRDDHHRLRPARTCATTSCRRAATREKDAALVAVAARRTTGVGDRLRVDAQAPWSASRRCSSARASRRRVPRRARRRAPPRGAGRVHERGRARDRRHERLRHGHRQAERARSSCTTPCPARSRRTTRRPDAPAATGSRPRCSCCTRFPIASRTSSSSRARIRSARSSSRCTSALRARRRPRRARVTLDAGATSRARCRAR